MWIHKLYFTMVSLCLMALPCQAEETRYIVSYVYDGDTVKLHPIKTFSQQYDIKLRLTQIDAPERNQPHGLKARRALIRLCQATNVVTTVDISGQDQYQRSLGSLQCNQVDASVYLVEQGLAWHNKKFSNNAFLAHAQQKAQSEKIGLWADENPMQPWVWRKLRANK